MMHKKHWIIEPRDALIVRDGRPFGATAGNRADSLEFPFPATTTGATRTRAGLSTIGGDLQKFKPELGDAVQQQITVRGPVLAEVTTEGAVQELLVAAPADCAVFQTAVPDETKGRLLPLVPLARAADTFTNLPNDLHLLGLAQAIAGKPHKAAPHFWRWAEFEQWLRNPHAAERTLAEIGLGGLPKDRRTHVKMDYAHKAGQTQDALFSTRGLEFGAQGKRYGLALEVDYGQFNGTVTAGVAPLGGERRLVAWRETTPIFPACPSEIVAGIVEKDGKKCCRLVLLTPAVFANGYRPAWSQQAADSRQQTAGSRQFAATQTNDGVRVEVQAVAVNRHQVISGYDFQRGRPKPTRRLCPAGTVFFLTLDGSETNLKSWVEKTWLAAVSDAEQDRRDGFGLAALGVWDGSFLSVEEALSAKDS